MHLLRVFYDPLIRSTMPDDKFRRLVLAPARMTGANRVLDIGCGTGAHAMLIKRDHPGIQVDAVDDDREAINLAKERAAKQAVRVAFRRGNATDLPFEDGAFDHVFSSLMFHHLGRGDKRRALSEIFRVLRPQGCFHLADFTRPNNWRMGLAFYLIRATHKNAWLEDNIRGALSMLIREAGFADLAEERITPSFFGSVGIFHACKPA